MPVYVDKAENGFRRMKMCHMIADTPEELHLMASRIGMRREWFQPRSFPHYDVAKGRRAQAIANGAIECDRKTFVGHMRRIREGDSFSGARR
jgi:hypothetical protein